MADTDRIQATAATTTAILMARLTIIMALDTATTVPLPIRLVVRVVPVIPKNEHENTKKRLRSSNEETHWRNWKGVAGRRQWTQRWRSDRCSRARSVTDEHE